MSQSQEPTKKHERKQAHTRRRAVQRHFLLFSPDAQSQSLHHLQNDWTAALYAANASIPKSKTLSRRMRNSVQVHGPYHHLEMFSHTSCMLDTCRLAPTESPLAGCKRRIQTSHMHANCLILRRGSWMHTSACSRFLDTCCPKPHHLYSNKPSASQKRTPTVQMLSKAPQHQKPKASRGATVLASHKHRCNAQRTLASLDVIGALCACHGRPTQPGDDMKTSRARGHLGSGRNHYDPGGSCSACSVSSRRSLLAGKPPGGFGAGVDSTREAKFIALQREALGARQDEAKDACDALLASIWPSSSIATFERKNEEIFSNWAGTAVSRIAVSLLADKVALDQIRSV